MQNRQGFEKVGTSVRRLSHSQLHGSHLTQSDCRLALASCTGINLVGFGGVFKCFLVIANSLKYLRSDAHLYSHSQRIAGGGAVVDCFDNVFSGIFGPFRLSVHESQVAQIAANGAFVARGTVDFKQSLAELNCIDIVGYSGIGCR